MGKIDNIEQDSVMLKYCRKKTEITLTEFELTGLSISNYDKGINREYIIRTLLEGFLPSNLRICSGEIIDMHDNSTGQIDLLIVRDNCPTIDITGPYKIYPIEGVLTAIEIKTNLDKDKLEIALNQLNKICTLKSYPYPPSHLPSPILERPMTIIFAYEGNNLNNIRELLDSFYNSHKKQNDVDTFTNHIDIISILNKGTLIRNELINFEKKQPNCNEYKIYEDYSEGLSRLLYHILIYCNANNFGIINFEHYFKERRKTV
jgi:hypothetical protein